LAQARYRVGQRTLIEVRQAEVQKSSADVQLLRDQQVENDAKLELFRLMGIVPPVDVRRIALTDSFPVTEPTFNLDDLLQMAEEENPALRALRYRSDAASKNVKAAKSAYLPSIFASAVWGGFTNQSTDETLLLQQSTQGAQGFAANCIYNDSIRTALSFPGAVGTPGCYQAAGLDPTGTALTSSTKSQIVDANNTFPFHFTKNPFQLSLGISLPLFTGFSRHLQVAQAREFEDDADENLRATGLLIRTEVNSRFLGLDASYKAIAAQATSRDAARDQLRLAEDRYRLGSGSSLEVTDAQNAVQRAEGDFIAAVFAYHRAVAILEAAVGRPLR
jgi:outer membrane protein